MKTSSLLAVAILTLTGNVASAAEYFTAMSNRGNVHCHEVQNPSNQVWIQYRAELKNEAWVNAKKLAREAGYHICEEDSVVVKRVASRSGGTVCGIEMTIVCGN